MHFNQQLLVTYECVNAIGTSLETESMLQNFLRVFSRKSGAIAAGFWFKSGDDFTFVCGHGKRNLYETIAPSVKQSSWDLQFRKSGEQVFYMYVGDGVMSFLFFLSEEELASIESILHSLHGKLNNAIRACVSHESLLNLNANLEAQIAKEVEKNREKDKHILQQSRLAQMGEMISMIAHQWRQPLGSIAAVIASVKVKLALKKFDLTTPQGQEALELFLEDSTQKIENYLKFLTTTIDDFRNFFKSDKRKEKTTLNELIERTLGIVGKALEINGITLVKELDSQASLELYTNEVMQVILNLLKNAEDVIKERAVTERTVWIRSYDKQNQAFLEVEDSGGGIALEIIERVFEPYFSTKEEKNGTGLGLYMSKIIIEDHAKGHINVHNTPSGACFRVILDISKEQ